MLGIISFYLKTSSQAKEVMKTLSHIWHVQGMNEAIWWDVYIIRGSYLTYL